MNGHLETATYRLSFHLVEREEKNIELGVFKAVWRFPLTRTLYFCYDFVPMCELLLMLLCEREAFINYVSRTSIV